MAHSWSDLSTNFCDVPCAGSSCPTGTTATEAKQTATTTDGDAGKNTGHPTPTLNCGKNVQVEATRCDGMNCLPCTHLTSAATEPGTLTTVSGGLGPRSSQHLHVHYMRFVAERTASALCDLVGHHVTAHITWPSTTVGAQPR